MICQYFPGYHEYESVWRKMQLFTEQRDAQTEDTVWFLEHSPVFTQGQAGKPEHLVSPGTIPVIQSDRGGQITYHGPGQLIIYTLFDLRRLECGIHTFTRQLHLYTLELLEHYHIKGHLKPEAPGVYVEDAKICSIGLRVRRGCTYHGLSLNVNMDLTPFQQIHPCGHRGLRMIHLHAFLPDITPEQVAQTAISLLPQCGPSIAV